MIRSLLLLVLVLATEAVTAQEINTKDNLGASGYDLVSYFNNEPLQGNSSYKTAHKGTDYLFSSNKNLEAFKANPEKYLPQYGGWCAYAMAQSGDRVSINPKAYVIQDGKLYLFYKAWGSNTLKKWLKNPDSLKIKADAYWGN